MARQIVLTGRVAVVSSDGSEHALPGRNARLVLAALALADGPSSRDVLADILWEDRLPSSWEASLRNTVARVRAWLRTGLGEECRLASSFGAWQLHLPPEVHVDVRLAQERLARADAAGERGDWCTNEAMAVLVQDTCSRTFLPGDDNEWVDGWRRTIRTWRLRALDAATEARLAQGHLATALLSAQEAVAAEPLRERGHQQVLRIHLAAGDRGAGLAAYERCRQILAAELGATPSPTTDALYLELLGPESAPTPGPTRSLNVPLPPSPRPFEGRVQEIEAIHSAWDAVQAGSRRTVRILGESGVGKTALVARVGAELASRGALVLYGATEEESQPYQPIVEALTRFVSHADEEQLRAAVGGEGDALAVLLPALRARPVASAGDVEEAVDRSRLFDAVVVMLCALASRQPVALILDDLHWAGPETVALIRHIARLTSATPLLLLLTHRETGTLDGPIARLIEAMERDPAGIEVPLRGFNAAELRSLADGLLSPHAAARRTDVVAGVSAATDGNPFLAVELLRELEGADEDETRSLLVADRVPEAARARIERRRRSLGEIGTTALAVGAIAGRTFDLSTVCSVGGFTEGEAMSALDAAVAAGLVRDIDGPIPRWAFTHAITRSAVWQSLGRERPRLCAAVAESWLARPDADRRAGEILPVLRAAGRRADATRLHAVAMQAADLARRECAWEIAAERYTIALDVATDDEQRLDCHLRLGATLQAAGLLDEARRQHLAAATSARALDDPERFAASVLGLAGGDHEVSAWFVDDEHRELLEEAHALLVGRGHDALEIRVASHLAFALYRPHEQVRRRDLLTRAVEQARALDDERVLGEVLRRSRIAYAHPRDAGARLATAEEALALAIRSGTARDRLDARMDRLSARAELVDRKGVDADLAVARDEADETHDLVARWRVAAWTALLAIVDGRADAAQESVSALQLWGDTPSATAMRAWGGQQLTLLTIAGRAAEAVPLARAGVEQFGREVPGYACALALTLAESGAPDEARRQIDEFLQQPGISGWIVDASWLCAMATLADAIFQVGHREAAQEVLPHLRPATEHLAFAGGITGLAFWGASATAVGLLEAAIGDIEAASRALRAGAAQCERFGATAWRDRAQQQLGLLHRT